MGELQAELQRLSGTALDAQGAANAWAGTTGLDLVGALNAKAGTTGKGLVAVLNQLAGTTGLDVNAAAGLLSSGGTFTLSALTSDNVVISGPDAAYANVTGGAAARILDTVTNASHTVGQYFATPNYAGYEYFLAFDTSGVTGTVQSASLSLWGVSDTSVTDFIIEVSAFDWGAAVDTTDFRTSAALGGLTQLATLSTAGFVTAAYNALTSTANFAAAINKAGLTKMVVASSRLRTATVPTGNEYVAVASADDIVGHRPKLVVVST